MKDDVKDSMPQEVRKEMETQLKSIIQQYMQRMNNNELVYRE
jgi:BMFP domain-containing protein YqiC